jgi:hypothetical protein
MEARWGENLGENKLGETMKGNMRKCCDCWFWCGRCVKNKPNKTAWSDACELFTRKVVTEIMSIEILKKVSGHD